MASLRALLVVVALVLSIPGPALSQPSPAPAHTNAGASPASLSPEQEKRIGEIAESRFDKFEKRLDQTLGFIDNVKAWFWGILLAIAGFLGSSHLYRNYQRGEFEKELDRQRREFDNMVRRAEEMRQHADTKTDGILESAQDAVEKAKVDAQHAVEEAEEEARKVVENAASESKDRFNKLVEFHRTQWLLAVRVGSLPEPSLRESLTQAQAAAIREHIRVVEDLRKTLDSTEDEGPSLSGFDCEMVGDSYHLLATSQLMKIDEKRRYEDTATMYYEKALKKQEAYPEKLADTKRKLANALAGAADAASTPEARESLLSKAIDRYRELETREDPRVFISLGDALNRRGEFERAADWYKTAAELAKKQSGKGSWNWGEARYQTANMSTALGSYTDAIEVYEDVLKTSDALASAKTSCLADKPFKPDWVNLSLGDAHRKRRCHETDLATAIEKFGLERGNLLAKAEIDFRIGQVHLALATQDRLEDALGKLEEARGCFREAENGNCNSILFKAYYGYVLSWCREGKSEADRQKANEYRQRAKYLLEGAERNQHDRNVTVGSLQTAYDYAVCVAMQGEPQKAIRALEQANQKAMGDSKYPKGIIATWASACGGLDFVGIAHSEYGRTEYQRIVGKELPKPAWVQT
jgi:tetratricopeptide (TPR) repeat protein